MRLVGINSQGENLPGPSAQARQERVDAAVREFGAAVLTDAEYGTLLRCVAEESARHRPGAVPARLRSLRRKLTRQREALRGGTAVQEKQDQ